MVMSFFKNLSKELPDVDRIFITAIFKERYIFSINGRDQPTAYNYIESTISNVRKDNCFLLSKLLNQRMTSFVLLY